MIDFEKIHGWLKGKFVMDSGFYAGRAPTETDLNSEILELFYQGILNDYGRPAAKNFVRFVNNLEDLSASSFIVAFERFAAKGYKDVVIEQREGDATRITAHGETRDVQAFAVLAQGMFGPRHSVEEIRSLSMRIKSKFIRNHASEIPRKEQKPSFMF